MKKILAVSALAGTFLFNGAYAAPSHIERETINQVALLQSLALGHFDGSITARDWKRFGDTGIGTFNGLDGELIMLDGVIYRANQDCSINVVSDSVTIPFSNITFFDKDYSVKLQNISDKAALESRLNSIVEERGVNSFYMVKITANFNSIVVRSEAKQVKPYPTLVQALERTQHELTCEDITGTIVGLYCPVYMGELNSVGWHFHFVSEDKTTGGHVLELNIKDGIAQLDKTDNFNLHLPKTKNFHALDLAQDLRDDIHKAETESNFDNKDEEVTETNSATEEQEE